MATTIRSSSSNSSTTGTAVSVTAPTGTTTGDVVIISVHSNGQTTIVDNNGATPFTEDINDYQPNPGAGHTVSVFSRRIQGGDPGTYNFTIGSSGRWSIIAVTFQNPHGTDIYDVAPNTANAANADDSLDNNIAAPSINTLTANAIHTVIGYSDDGTGTSPTPPSGYSQAQGTSNQPQGLATKVIVSAGATGAQTYTFTTFAARIALSFAIKDSGAATSTSTTTTRTTSTTRSTSTTTTSSSTTKSTTTTQSSSTSTTTQSTTTSTTTTRTTSTTQSTTTTRSTSTTTTSSSTTRSTSSTQSTSSTTTLAIPYEPEVFIAHV